MHDVHIEEAELKTKEAYFGHSCCSKIKAKQRASYHHSCCGIQSIRRLSRLQVDTQILCSTEGGGLESWENPNSNLAMLRSKNLVKLTSSWAKRRFNSPMWVFARCYISSLLLNMCCILFWKFNGYLVLSTRIGIVLAKLTCWVTSKEVLPIGRKRVHILPHGILDKEVFLVIFPFWHTNDFFFPF